MTSDPVVTQNKGISAIWTLPVVALCICCWLIYSSYKNAGEEITIYFQDASGLTPGKTQVVTRGIPIGLVKSISPDLPNQQIKAIVKIDKEAVDYLVEDTLFWIVRPELSASSIRGLETILSGSYIGVQVGRSKNSKTQFEGLPSPPPIPPDTPGLHLHLRAEALGSIQVGTGIYYRNIKVGYVTKHDLNKDEGVLIDFFIEPKFSHLVRVGSRFCNASGMQISGKLPLIKMHVESLAALLKGGILLYTPEQLQDSEQVASGHTFSLYKDYEAANYGISMTLTLASGEDIVETSTKVMYRGLEAGFVKEISINDDEQRTVTAHILLDPRAELILKENTKFWLVKPEIAPSGIHNLQLLLSGAYITFQPGAGGYKNHFNILSAPPPLTPLRPGKSFILVSQAPTGVGRNAPVYFKNIVVGTVVNVDLERSGKNIHTNIYIYDEYLHLLSTKSIFWLQSGVEISASLEKGFSLSTGPLTKMLNGGISFTTPDKLARKKNFSPKENDTFTLHDSYEKATEDVPELQRSGITVKILSKDASSLSIGAPVLHKNIQIGVIKNFSLTKDQQNVLVDCFIYDEYKGLIHSKTRFYNTSGFQFSGGLDGVRFQTGSLNSIIKGGIGCLNLEKALPKKAGSPYPLYNDLAAALHSDEVELTVRMQATKGLREGSAVRYKGIQVGKVRQLSFTEDLQFITAKILVDRKVETLFKKGTRVWVTEAEINLNGIKNVETIVSGSYLDFLPGEGPPERYFTALNSPPQVKLANLNGMGIILDAKHLGSVSTGSPIYYRQVQVGRVTGYELSPTFQKVQIFASIDERYRPIIRSNTKFWNVSGATIKGGLFSGVTVTTQSIESIMKGGIALATPEKEEQGIAASPGDHFKLYEKAKKEWLDWNPDVIVLELEESEAILNQEDGGK